MKASTAEDQRWWRATWLAFVLGWVTTVVVMPGVVAPVSDGVARMHEAHWAWSGETTGGVLTGRNGILHALPEDWACSFLPRACGMSRTTRKIP